MIGSNRGLKSYEVPPVLPDVILTLDGNGGVTGDGSSSYAVVLKLGEKYLIPSGLFTRASYKLLGYSTNASSTTASWAEGSYISIKRDYTMYAIWAVSL